MKINKPYIYRDLFNRWLVARNGKLIEVFSTWQEALDYANNLAAGLEQIPMSEADVIISRK